MAIVAAALLSSFMGGGKTLPEGAAALYKDTAISEETVAYLESAYAQAGQTVSREKIIDQLLMNCVVEEAAAQAGFAAGEDEVAALLDVQRQTYEEFPEAREVVDGYCEEQGITLEIMEFTDYIVPNTATSALPTCTTNCRDVSLATSKKPSPSKYTSRFFPVNCTGKRNSDAAFNHTRLPSGNASL